jgi:ribosome biogenesis protein BMS1
MDGPFGGSQRPAGGKHAHQKKKRKEKTKKVPKGANPKAFTYQSVNTVKKDIQRSADLSARRVHIPVRDRLAEVEVLPPVLVAVAGPAGVGKSTLIRSLVKHYTKQSIAKVIGPVTVVSGKKRRITFLEVLGESLVP